MSKAGTMHVVGLGNLLRGDDGIGVRIVAYLRERGGLGEGVILVDGGASVLDVLTALGGGRKLVVLDAVRGGGSPGTVLKYARAAGTSFPQSASLCVRNAGHCSRWSLRVRLCL